MSILEDEDYRPFMDGHLLPSDSRRITRIEARYRLATLLTESQFQEASRLAQKWFDESIIHQEDFDFVAAIVEGSKNRPKVSATPPPPPPRTLNGGAYLSRGMTEGLS